ncbi:MAG: hypothetical protein IJC87_01310 [Clostridia bacterium]|nr:hypothetical protein [Clostridia bacterium]
MKSKIKGILLLVLTVVFSLCLFACQKPGESSSESGHQCQFENWQVTTQASCETDGEETATCSCGETSTRVIPAIGHTFGEWTTKSQSTCSEKGLEKSVCETCGKERERELALLEHDFEKFEKEPTCEEEGLLYEKCSVCGEETDGTPIPKLAHDLVEEVSGRTLRSNQTCESKATYWKTCGVCGEISNTDYFAYGELSDHILNNAYSCAVNFCRVCEDEFPATSEHNFGEWIEVGASSCSSTVVKFHVCQDCGYAEDELGLQNAVTHHDIVFTETKATCEQDGSFVVSCVNCDFETVVTYGAIGHVYKWEIDENGHRQICLRDNCDSVINQGEHRASNSATCEQDEICVVCNYLICARHNHSWVSIPDKAPTCEQDGYKNAKQCENCQKIIKITVKGGHDFVFVSGKQATCEENGTIAHNHCENCQKDYDLQGNYLSSVVIDKLGHDYSNAWSYDEETHYKECSRCDDKNSLGEHVSSGNATETKAETCTVCGYVITPKLGHTHNYNTEVIEPTCTKEGYTLHTCSGCGHTKKTDFVEKVGHSFGAETIETELSCENDEIFKKECSVCHKIERRVGRKALSHDEGGWETQTEPTCTENGVAYKRCQRQGCGKVLDEKVLEKKGHVYREIERVKPTCEQDGYVVYKCDNCTDSHRSTLAKLGHDESDWKVETDATCEENGVKYTVCQRDGCGKRISTGVILAKGHDESDWKVETNATCEENGLKVKYCTKEECGKKLAEETIPALNHDESDWKVETDATCEENGVKYTVCQRDGCGKRISTGVIPAKGHSEAWRVDRKATCEESGLKVKYCTKEECGKELAEETIPALGHSEGEWIIDKHATCEEDGAKHTVCQRENCGITISTGVIPALGHDESDWIIDKHATCEEEGAKHTVCQRENCGITISTDVIPAKGHSGEWRVEKDATCEEDGLKGKYCTVKGCEKRYEEEVISALGHDESEWIIDKHATCEGEGAKHTVCQRENCGITISTGVIPAKGHNGEWEVVKDATCQNEGLKEKRCTRENCGIELDSEVIPMLEHNGEWEVVKDATCHEEGLRVERCTRENCGIELDSEVIPMLEHSGKWEVVREATCNKEGLKIEYCTRENCREELNREKIPALGHNGEWEVVKDATCEEDGFKVEYCTRENCREELNRENIPMLGHDHSGEYCWDDNYHYFECNNGCGQRLEENAHSYTQILHENVIDDGKQIVYEAYIEFACECGYSFDSETVTNTTHQSIVAIDPVAPTCTEVGYTVGLKCGIEGCDEIFLEPTEIPALGHDMVNGKCLRCGENQTQDMITVYVRMEFANGEVWEDFDDTDAGHTIYSYFKTWGMFDSEINNICYLEIDEKERPVEDLYSYELKNGTKIFVRFADETVEEEDRKSVYVALLYNVETKEATSIVYFAETVLTLKEFYAYTGIDSKKVTSISVGNAEITDENHSLGQFSQINIHYSEQFMPNRYALAITTKVDENGMEIERSVFYLSMDVAEFTINDVAIVFGYAYGDDFIGRENVTVNGEKMGADYQLKEGDNLVTVLKVQAPVPDEKFVNIYYECVFADGIVENGNVEMRKGANLYDFVDKICDYASWSSMLFADIKSVNFNDEEIVDFYNLIFEEDGSIKIKFLTFNSEISTIWVNVKLAYADGGSDGHDVEIVKGATFEDLIKWICTYDSWQEIFNDVEEIFIDGIKQDKYSFVFEGSCSIEIKFATYAPPVQTTYMVEFYLYDLNGVEQIKEVFETDAIYLMDLLNNKGLTEVILSNIKEIRVNGKTIDDIYSFLIESNCLIEVYIDVNQGGSDKNVITVVSYNPDGTPVGGIVSFEIDGTEITLRELIERNTPFGYEEFIEQENGIFYYCGEELSAESVIYVNTTIEFRYNEYVAPEKVQIYFDSDFYNGYISISKGYPIGRLFEENLPHPFVYVTFAQFVENGDVYVDGVIVYSSDYELNGGETVRYDHRDNKCDEHVWNEYGYCANCGYECPHDNIQDGSACPECGYYPTHYREYRVVLLMGDYVENDPFYDCGCQETCVKAETRALKDFTLSLILQSDGGWLQDRITQAQEFGYYYVWTVGGNVVSDSDVIDEYAIIVGVLSRVTIEPFTVTVNSADYGERVYEYSYPVSLEVVFERYRCDLGLHVEYFYAKMEQGFDGDILTADCLVECVEYVHYISYQIISANDEGEWQQFSYKATQTPTVEQVIEKLGLSSSEYSAYRYGRKIEDLDEKVSDNLTLFENALFSDEFTVTIKYKQSSNSQIETYTVIVDCPASVSIIIEEKLRKLNPDVEIWSDPYNYAIRVDGVLFGSGKTDAYFDYYYNLIYDDCIIEISKAIKYYIGGDNVNYDKPEIISDKALNGEEILQMAHILDDWSSLLIFINDMRYSLEEFKSTVFSDEDKGEIHISIRKGMVYVNVEVIDENDYCNRSNYESYEEIDLNYFGISGSFSDYEITVTLPSGETVTLTDYDYKFKFNSEFAQEYGDRNYRTEYYVKFAAKTFRVTLNVDGVWQGEKFFEKGNSYSLSEILAQFGDYQIENYSWNVRTNNGDWLDVSSPIERAVDIEAYDVRPRIFLSVEGQEYVIYHTEDVTLARLLELVKSEYGVEIKYEDFCWNYELDSVVAWSQDTVYVYARILTQVRVTFYSEYGWVENGYDEFGNMGSIYQQDSEWIYPTVDLEPCYNLMLFTGKWEYRSETMTKVVTSVQDLFAIGKEGIELWAVCELDYEKLMGTYFVEEERRVIVIGENNSIIYNDQWGNDFTSTFHVVPSGMGFALEVWDYGCIDAMWLQDCYKLSQDAFVYLVLDPFGTWNTFTSYDEYVSYVENYEVSEIKNVYGENSEEVGQSGIYYVYLLEKTYE